MDIRVDKFDFSREFHLPRELAVKTELADRRVQSMEVAGQEILTRDKVSLRINLTALWQVLDVVKARAELTNFVDFVLKDVVRIQVPSA